MSSDLFCKDCRFSDRHPSLRSSWICMHPSSLVQPRVNLVTGFTMDSYQLYCREARKYEMPELNCGPGGKHWEPGELDFGAPSNPPPAAC